MLQANNAFPYTININIEKNDKSFNYCRSNAEKIVYNNIEIIINNQVLNNNKERNKRTNQKIYFFIEALLPEISALNQTSE